MQEKSKPRFKKKNYLQLRRHSAIHREDVLAVSATPVLGPVLLLTGSQGLFIYFLLSFTYFSRP